MKPIFNWRKATVADIEADNLLDEATLMHVLSYQMVGGAIKSIDKTNQYERIQKFFQHHIDNEIPIVMHNGISYDVPLVEKILGMDLSKLMLIDTLGLSWYLNFDRKIHGLDSFLEDYGIKKPPVDDWENLTYEEYEERCRADVEINQALWQDLFGRLEEMYTRAKEVIDNGDVGGKRVSEDEEIHLDSLVGLSVDEHINRILTFLNFKMDCARLQEKTQWEVDVPYLDESLEELHDLLEAARIELEGVMPKVPKYAPRKKPAKPYKKNGELSASGANWQELQQMLKDKTTDDAGNPMAIANEDGNAKVLKGYEEPNVNSSQQIKDFLYSKGWEPETFKYDRDSEAFQQWIDDKPAKGSPRMMWSNWKHDRPEDRKIPQLSVEGKDGKELCPSVVRMAEDIPEIMAYSKYTTIKHRSDLLKGFKEGLRNEKYLQARVGGFTNTLRVKHREIVNLPGVDKPYGENVRGCLIAGEGRTSLGSDLSGLEDRVKHHFMLPHDPEYVATMQQDDYDAHLTMAVVAEFITQEEMNAHLAGEETEKTKSSRKLGKSTNYAAVYNSGPPTLARTAKIELETAKQLLEGYWKLNWSVKVIAEEQVVITDSRNKMWLVNPLNGFCYSLRKENDKFSTLCQGTGSYIFDVWVGKILDKQQATFNTKRLTGSFHDEYISVFRDSERNRKLMESITHEALEEINKEFKLRRKMGCDVQYGQRYSDIH